MEFVFRDLWAKMHNPVNFNYNESLKLMFPSVVFTRQFYFFFNKEAAQYALKQYHI